MTHPDKSAPDQSASVSISLAQRLQRVVQEAGALLMALLALMLFLALYSFNPQDPGWNQVASQAATNLMGLTGAWTADVLFSLAGAGAWLLPLVLFHLAVQLIRRPWRQDDWAPFIPSLRFAGLLLLLMSVSALAVMHFYQHEVPWPYGTGGILGESLSSFMTPLLGHLGATLVFLGACIAGFSLVTGWSWLLIMDEIGHGLVATAGWVISRWRAASEVREEAQAQRLAQREAAEEEKPSWLRQPVEPAEFALNPQDDEFEAQQLEADHEPQLRLTMEDEVAQAAVYEDRWASSQEDEADQLDTHASQAAPWEAAVADFDVRAARSVDDTDELIRVLTGAEAATSTNPEPSIRPPWEADPEVDESDDSSEADALESAPLAEETPARPSIRLLTARDLHADQGKAPMPIEGDKPGLNLLNPPQPQKAGFTPQALQSLGELLQQRLTEFGVKAQVTEVHPGPVITRFELELAPGVKSSKVSGLALDLARALRVPSVRVVEVISGKSTIGIELPNAQRSIISLMQVLDHESYSADKHPLPLALGQDIAGKPVIVNLAKMPHLLVAGTTGSGKSVGINAMLLSLLLQRTPEQLRLIMIDPKMLELSVYEGIPHLLAPVVTDMKEAANSLRWCVAEMERRYQLMSALGVRNIQGFNAKLDEAEQQGGRVVDPIRDPLPGDQPILLEKLPYIVVVVDEFADMMMLVGKKVEELIARLAQKARAAGIHLILATQRPSVDVITGLIKANIPTRIAFQVSSKIDSRTILDQGGAEQLLGNGDMLYLPTGAPQPERVHGAFVSDEEVHHVVENWKQRQAPEYEESILSGDVEAQALAGLEADGNSASVEDSDPLYDEAVAFVMESRRASTSAVQRRFKIGYNRAARLVDAMEAAGLVSPLGSNGQRELLIPER